MKKLLLPSAVFLLTAVSSQAATIVWGNATNVSSSTDISLKGSLVEAYDIGSAVDRTINGVLFSAAGPSGWGDANFASYGNAGMSGAYGEALNDGTYTNNNGSRQTHTFTGLTSGQQYEFQVWFNDNRNGSTVNANTLTGADGGVELLGNGQYAIGTFTADSTGSQDLTWTETGSISGGATLNLVQLRAVPEPSSAALLGLGGLALLLRRRK